MLTITPLPFLHLPSLTQPRAGPLHNQLSGKPVKSAICILIWCDDTGLCPLAYLNMKADLRAEWKTVLQGNSNWGRATGQMLGKGRWPAGVPQAATTSISVYGVGGSGGGGGWVSAAGSRVGSQRIWALGWMLFSWRAGSGWISGSGPQVSWCALLSQAFFPWSREEPDHWGSTLHQQWPQRAERAGIQVLLPATGILIGL